MTEAVVGGLAEGGYSKDLKNYCSTVVGGLAEGAGQDSSCAKRIVRIRIRIRIKIRGRGMGMGMGTGRVILYSPGPGIMASDRPDTGYWVRPHRD